MNRNKRFKLLRQLLLITLKIFIICLLIYLIPFTLFVPELTNISFLKALIGLLTPLAYVIILCIFIETTVKDFNLFIKTNFSYRLAEFSGIFYLVLVIYSSFILISFSVNWLYFHPSFQQVDYSVLTQMLKGEKWLESDKKTQEIMLKIVKREKQGWLSTRAIETFPCESLKIIDSLWRDASNNKYGFSIQANIWKEQNNNDLNFSSYEIQAKFLDKIGWTSGKKTSLIDYPKGYFPTMIGTDLGKACVTKLDQLWFGQSVGCYHKILMRIEQCHSLSK